MSEFQLINNTSAELSRRDYVLAAVKKFPSQAKAAELIGTSPRVVSKWVTGNAYPREMAVRVIQLLEVLLEHGIEIPDHILF